MKSVRDSCDGGSASSVLLRNGLRSNGTGVRGGSYRDEGGHSSTSLDEKGLKSANSGGGNELCENVVLIVA